MHCKGLELLSQSTVYSKYSRYLPQHGRRETWDEIVDRQIAMHARKYPQIEKEIATVFEYVRRKEIVGSMRMAQFAGLPIELSPSRGYNCAFVNVDSHLSFREILFLLLGGTGVGFSVQWRHVRHLPVIRRPILVQRWKIGDSIEGWADALHRLIKGYMCGGARPLFDYADIRPRGAPINKTGGQAPGSDGLREALENVEWILVNAIDRQLKPIEVHDLICFASDAVLSGGVRRSATISLFDWDDHEMLTAKDPTNFRWPSGNDPGLNPQRARANNSVVCLRGIAKDDQVHDYWQGVLQNGTGEPGIFFTNNPDHGTNPCAEISLKSQQFCNLSEVNVSIVESPEQLKELAKAAAYIGTLQAGYTQFHYLRPSWRSTTEADALLGVSITGSAREDLASLDLSSAALAAVVENKRVAKLIGINPAARVTTGKPSGTTSAALGTASGCHAWYAPFYIRRTQHQKDEPLVQAVSLLAPEMVQQHLEKKDQVVIEFPCRAPDSAVTINSEGAINFLERVKLIFGEWISPGHIRGSNSNNQSATCTYLPEEIGGVADWLTDNRHCYNGMTVLPKYQTTYAQAPFEEIDQAEYNRRSAQLPSSFHLDQLQEGTDNTELAESIACSGGKCEI